MFYQVFFYYDPLKTNDYIKEAKRGKELWLLLTKTKFMILHT